MDLIADTTVISNFALVKRLDILQGIGKLSTTVEVVGELKVAIERGIFEMDLSRSSLDVLKWIKAKWRSRLLKILIPSQQV